MKEEAILNLIQETPKILPLLYVDLAQPSVKKIGVALETVFEFSTSFLLPIKLLNEKFKLNFQKRINEYKKKLEDIPDDKTCQVNPQIGVPLIEKLSYITNDEIADLFTNLLAKASSIDHINMAHPSFVHLLDRLSVDEARIIKYLYNKEIIPSISFHAYRKDSPGFIMALKNGTPIPFDVELLFPKNINIYLDNFVSMGILDNAHGFYKEDEVLYSSLIQKYHFESFNEKYTKSNVFERLEIVKSYYDITNFGRIFISACNKI